MINVAFYLEFLLTYRNVVFEIFATLMIVIDYFSLLPRCRALIDRENYKTDAYVRNNQAHI